MKVEEDPMCGGSWEQRPLDSATSEIVSDSCPFSFLSVCAVGVANSPLLLYSHMQKSYELRNLGK